MLSLVLMALADTATPTCANPFADASVVEAVTPGYPDSAFDLGIGPVTVLVSVTVNPDGSMNALHIVKSSNNMAIDQSALIAARRSTYAPKIVNCSATLGDVLFKAVFDPANRSPNVPLPCNPRYADASFRREVRPAYPDSARAQGAGSAIVLVHVTVGLDGSVRWATVTKSSGNAAMDQAALEAARASQYTPKTINCSPTYGDFIFRAEFNP